MKLHKYLHRYLSAAVGSFIIVTLLSVMCICLLPNKTLAVQDGAVGKGLTLAPLRSELEIAPGTSLTSELMITNSTDKPMVASLTAEEFSVINQQYDYAFDAESDLAKWATFNPVEVNLAVGESKKVQFTIGVPLSAEPGGRYLSLFASTDIKTSDGGVNSRQRVASLLYITVIGDVTRSGHLISLASPWGISDKSMWSMALQNIGTTHFHSRYNVQLQNLWGNTVASMSGDALILPGTVRAVPDVLPLPQLPGLYKIIYTIGLGDTPAIAETRFVLYMPPMAILASVIIVMLLIAGLLRRRFNKH